MRQRDDTGTRRRSPALALVRIVLPSVIAVAGVAAIVAGSTALGATLLAVAVLVVLANVFIRVAMTSSRDRDEEQRARARFMRTGRWPE